MSNNVTFINPSVFAPSLAPYSQGAKAGNLIVTAGQVALDNENKIVGLGDIAEQTRVTIERIRTVLAEAGASLTDIFYAQVWLTDMADFPAFNTAWGELFGGHRPARATVRSDLALDGLLIEIQVMAMRS